MKKFIGFLLLAAGLAAQPVTQIGTGNVSGNLYFGGTSTGGYISGTGGRITYTPIGSGGHYFIGTIGINITPDINISNYLAGTVTGSTGKYGYVDERTAASDVTSLLSGFSTSLKTVASSFTLSTVNHFSASSLTVGAGSTVTEQNGFRAGASLNAAVVNYGFRGQLVASGTARWNVYMDGTAPNHFAGEVYIGSSTDLGAYALQVTGNSVITGVDSVTNTTEATTGGAGSINTLGGIYAAKKIISGSSVTALGTIELGDASDTTLARSSAGVVTIEGVVVDTISAANTLTNKTLTAPTLTGTVTVTGTGGATIDNSSASAGAISSSGGGQFNITAPIQLSGNVKDSAGSFGTDGYALIGNGSGALTYQFIKRSTPLHFVCYPGTTANSIGSTATFFGGNNRTEIRFDSTGYTQVRVRCHIGGTASNATTTLYARYYTSNSTTLSDFLPAGTGSTEVSVGLNTTINQQYTGNWTTLTSGAVGDVYWVLVVQDSANAALNPSFSSVSLEFR